LGNLVERKRSELAQREAIRRASKRGEARMKEKD